MFNDVVNGEIMFLLLGLKYLLNKLNYLICDWIFKSLDYQFECLPDLLHIRIVRKLKYSE
jgi:hypothetical protein